jgi:hypothetical protein
MEDGMKRLLPIVAATLTLIMAAPVAAQPLEIIVRGGTPTYLPTPLGDDDAYIYGTPRNENFPNFDPAAAAINAELAIHPRSKLRPNNLWLVTRLAVTSGSWTEHMEVCQATYATYDPVSDTYLAGGLPRRCPL